MSSKKESFKLKNLKHEMELRDDNLENNVLVGLTKWDR